MAIVLLGGGMLSGLGGVSPLNPVLVAAGAAQALVLGFGRAIGQRGRYLPGLLLFIGAYALAEAREGRGVESRLLVPALVLLALVRIRLSLVPSSPESDEFPEAKIEEERPAPSPWFWLARLLLPLLLTLLGLYSGGAGGAERMSASFDWLPSDIAWNVLVFVRKLIHSTFYPLLACGALVTLWRLRPNIRANAPWALGLTAIFAVFDEVRQSAVPGRSGSAWDVLLDLVAATIVLAIVVRRTKLKA